jgi:ABC-type spermidine/putrescine transport system permease subunit I
MTLTQLKRTFSAKPRKGLVVGIPYAWLLVLFLIPFVIVFKISFAEQELAIPPYSPLFTADTDMGRLNIALSYQNYADIFQNFWSTLGQMLNPFADGRGNNIYLLTYWLSIKTALTTTVICCCWAIRLPMPFRAPTLPSATACCWRLCCLFGPHSCCACMPGWACSATTASSIIF